MNLPSLEPASIQDWLEQQGVVQPDVQSWLDLAQRRGKFLAGLVAAGEMARAFQQPYRFAAKDRLALSALSQWLPMVDDSDNFGLSDARLSQIIRQIIQNVYITGRWIEAQRQNCYLQFSAINDDRTTEHCRSCDGIIRHVTHDFWKRHSPPCHWNCRSTIILLSPQQAWLKSGSGTGLFKEETSLQAAEGFGIQPTIEQDTVLHLMLDRLLSLLPDPLATAIRDSLGESP